MKQTKIERYDKMIKLLKYFKKQDWLMFLCVFLWRPGGIDLTLPDYMSEITSLVQTQGSLMKIFCRRENASVRWEASVCGGGGIFRFQTCGDAGPQGQTGGF